MNSAKIQWGLLFYLSLMSFAASVEASIGVIVSRTLPGLHAHQMAVRRGGAGLEEAATVMWA